MNNYNNNNNNNYGYNNNYPNQNSFPSPNSGNNNPFDDIDKAFDISSDDLPF